MSISDRGEWSGSGRIRADRLGRVGEVGREVATGGGINVRLPCYLVNDQLDNYFTGKIRHLWTVDCLNSYPGLNIPGYMNEPTN